MKKYLNIIRKEVCLTLLISTLISLVMSTMTILPGYLLDNCKNGISFVRKMVLLYAVLFMIYLFLSYFSNRVSDYRRIKFERSLRKDFFAKSISASWEKFSELKTGEYISILSNDMNELIQNYLSPLMAVFTNLFTIIIYGVSMVLFVDPLIAFIIIGISILMTFVPDLTAKKLSVLYGCYLSKLGKYTSAVGSFYSSKVFLDSKEINAITSEHNRQIDQVLTANMKYRKRNSLAMVLNGGSVEAISCIAFALIAIQLYSGRITAGMASSAFLYATKFMDPLYEFNVNIGRVKSTKEMKKRVLSILYRGSGTAALAFDSVYSLAIRDVTKKYGDIKICFQDYFFGRNKKYLVIGKNGTGKSTLLAILAGVLKPDSGGLFINGKEVSETLLDVISYLPQDSMIFPTDYWNNVTVYGAYSDLHLKKYEKMFPEEMIQAIKKNPDLETLSGGEKQIVCILRVLCSDKEFIIMDEPFSAMNQACIEKFVNSISSVKRTMIITAHNLNEYFDSFDEIIELRK